MAATAMRTPARMATRRSRTTSLRQPTQALPILGCAAAITFVQSGASKNANASTISATLPSATKDGSLLAVLVTYSNTAYVVSSITDNGTGGSSTYVSANTKSSTGTCQASEIWFARSAHANATSVSVTISGSVMASQLWIVEATGLGPIGGADSTGYGSGSASTTITTPTVTPKAAPALLVAVVGSCGTIGPIANGNSFIALAVQDGNNAAYYVAPTTGSFGAVFNNTNAAWNASLAAFR